MIQTTELVHALTANRKPLAARRKNLQIGAGAGERNRGLRALFDDVLAVVEDDEPAPRPQRVGQLGERLTRAGDADGGSRGDLADDRRALRHGGEIGEPRGRAMHACELLGRLDGNARLADAAGADDGDDAVVLEH
ncbi:MAG TPA: hypothetical protein VMU38_11160 [Candidatus Binatia bacterium]|nr:hypothetical protein [Candidatus Binatia bacterium]